jgi:nitrite reductase/ring-hydroxylating ferredoxin subunit
MLPDPTDSWVPVALSQDLPAGTVIPARIPTGSIALWRSQSGRVSAAADRCPHRGMRLSHGFVRGEALSCIYHGWSYSQGGHCLRIPAHPGLVPPDTIRVATHVVEEANGVVWVADGEPAVKPPVLEDSAPLRSVNLRAGRQAIEAAAGAAATAGMLTWQPPSAPTIRLLVGAEQNGETPVHILVPAQSGTAERLAASRAGEALRRAAEAIEAKGAA